MTITRKKLPNLWGGISEQDPAVRAENQMEDVSNFNPDPVKGLSKRFGSEFIGPLSSTQGAYGTSIPSFVVSGTDESRHQHSTFQVAGKSFHFKDSNDDDYIWSFSPISDHTDGQIDLSSTPWSWLLHKLNKDGTITEQTINDADGSQVIQTSEMGDSANYFKAAAHEQKYGEGDSQGDWYTPFKTLGIEDTVFFLNQSRDAGLSSVSATIGDNKVQGCIFVKEGQFNTQYEVMLKITDNNATGRGSQTNLLRRHVIVRTSDGLEDVGNTAATDGHPNDADAALIARAIMWGLDGCPTVTTTAARNNPSAAQTRYNIGQWQPFYSGTKRKKINGGTYAAVGTTDSQTDIPTVYAPDGAGRKNRIQVLAKASGDFACNNSNGNDGESNNNKIKFFFDWPTLDYTSDKINDISDQGVFVLNNLTSDGASSIELDIKAADSFNAGLIDVFGNVRERYEGLPTKCLNGYYLKIEGSPESELDDYYIQFRKDDTDSSYAVGEGQWVECVKRNIKYHIDEYTMPHQLVKDPDNANTWILKTVDWSDRDAGDETLNSNPGFIGKKINDIFSFRSRMGFVAGETVSMSEVDSPYNFFRTTQAQALASDRIKLETSLNEQSDIHHAVDFANQLVLFSEKAQYIVDYGDQGLTPQTASLAKVANYECSKRVRPAATESVIYFAEDGTESTNIWEMAPTGRTGTSFAAAKISDNVPELLAGRVYNIVADSKTKTVVVHCKDTEISRTTSQYTNNYPVPATEQVGQDRFYVYKYYDQGNERVQSAWVKYEMYRNDSQTREAICNCWFIDDYLYYTLVADTEPDAVTVGLPNARINEVQLERLYIPNDREINYCLDKAVVPTTQGLSPSYDAGTGVTTFTLPYYLPRSLSGTDPILIDVGNGYSALTCSATGSGYATVSATGNWTANTSDFALGFPFPASVTLSEQYFVTQNDALNRPVAADEARTTVKWFNVSFAEPPSSSNQYIKLLASYTGSRADNEKVWNLGGGTAYGQKYGEDKRIALMVAAKNKDTTLKIVNDTYQPITVNRADVELNINDRLRYRN